MIMYQNSFAVALKHNGKILRENKDLVQLPFGSEFSVLVKNLNSRRAKFTLHIDGTDVLDGTEIIVNANSEVEMKRFIRNGNMNEGNAFKFIERTQAIEDGPRGIKVDDGIVRVEFWFEKELPEIKTVYHKDIWWTEPYYPYRPVYWGEPLYNGTLRSANISEKTKGIGTVYQNSVRSSVQTASGQNMSASSASFSANVNDVGITVPGSKIEQKFQTVYEFNSEVNSHVIVIRMAGRKGEVEVVEAVTVKMKQKCSACNHTNKASSSFCSKCGTSLNLL